MREDLHRIKAGVCHQGDLYAGLLLIKSRCRGDLFLSSVLSFSSSLVLISADLLCSVPP